MAIGTMKTIQVGIQPARIASFMVPNETFLLVNPDIVNNIFIGNDPGIQPIAVPALGSITLTPDKSHDIWISTGGGNYTVNAYALPNGSNWVPSPAQVAAQINALGLAKDSSVQATNTALGTSNTNTGSTATNTANTNTSVQATPQSTAALIATGNAAGAAGGVPLLRQTKTLGNGSAQTLTAGVMTTLLNKVSINQPSYEGLFSLFQAAATGTLPFASIVFNWFDSFSGLNVASKFFTITSGNGSGNALLFYISGPCFGNQLTVTITDLEPSTNQTLTWALNSTSHQHLIDRIYQSVYATTGPNGFSNPNGNPSMGLLFEAAPAIGPSGTINRLLAVNNAVIDISIDDGAQANGLNVKLLDVSGQLTGTANTQLLIRNIAAGNRDFVEMALPSAPVVLQLQNIAGTNTITPTVAGTIRAY